jgi:integrase
MRTVLRRALGQAEREGIISRNVAALSSPPRIRAKEGRTLTVEQAKQLLDAADGYRFGATVVLALAYGMRRGEVLGLHWKAGTLAVTMV